MKFEDVLKNGKLWSVVYDGDTKDILTKTLSNWIDIDYLTNFFIENREDLQDYFRITNLDEAVFDTIADATSMACLILDLSPTANLNGLFRPLEPFRMSEMSLSKEKAKGNRVSGHSSWLRIYAIKLDDNVYLITGGAIKLTHLMEEREHTLAELNKMEKVRNYLIENGVFNSDGFNDYLKDL